jgi:hypothetical protein
VAKESSEKVQQKVEAENEERDFEERGVDSNKEFKLEEDKTGIEKETAAQRHSPKDTKIELSVEK